MIRERQEARNRKGRRQWRKEYSKFIFIVAMVKCSYDPREDFKESMVQMIIANQIQEPKDLRRFLNYYFSMNDEEYYGAVLKVLKLNIFF